MIFRQLAHDDLGCAPYLIGDEKDGVAAVVDPRFHDLPARVEAQPSPQLLDVREHNEWDAEHIPGSTSAPWHDIDAMPDGVDASRPIAVLCTSGQRAATAASLVQRFGGREIIHIVGGGVPKWGRLGHPMESAVQAAGTGG